jgi:hypothetical protein
MERLGDGAGKVLRDAGPPSAGDLLAVTRAWPAAVGPGIAAAAWPTRIARDGTLHVAASSAVWAFELGHMQSQVLEQLRSAVPGLAATSVRFAVGPVPEAAAVAAEELPSAPRPTDDDRGEAARLAAVISDRELRDTVARAAAASLARARDDRSFW